MKNEQRIKVPMPDEQDVSVEIWASDVGRALSPESLAQVLERYTNNFSSNFERGKQAGKALQDTHRTLQRSIIVELVGILAGLADQPEQWTDLRNAQAVALAKRIVEVYEEIGAGVMV